jgi:predicted alpha/beta-hydrolase family hydrolase
MTPYVNGLQSRGIAATAIDLPTRKAEDAIPAFHKVVPREPWVVVGGQSYGGRVASLAAAEPGAPYAALVLFSYPLHPPGSPEKADARTAHWPQIRCPVLLLSGGSDPFAKIDLLRAAVPHLGGHAELVTYPKLGHGLMPVLDDVLDRVAAFLAEHTGRDSPDPLP